MNWLRKQKGKLFLLLVFLNLFFVSPVFAQTDSPGLADKLAGFLAHLILFIASGAGQLITLLIGGVLIPIILYDDFVNSPVVGAGWAVVRDAVNMFFVLVLIAIAFGTILGGLDRFEWQKQVRTLLTVAIFINFSRTLCGLMIDFSQVFTLTFANAIKDIAGGNLIQMFGLGSIMEARSNPSLINPNIEPSDLLISAICALVMMLIVLVALAFFTIVLAYRIVVLWVLVTVAPLAWFFKSTKGIIKLGKDPYSSWWSNFTCAIVIGPVLTFTLWLALAVAGSGEISETAGIASSATSLDTGLLLEALSASKVVSFIIGICILFAGLQASQDACEGAGAMGAMVKSQLGKAERVSKKIAAAPAKIAAIPAGWAGAKALAGGRLGLEGLRAGGKFLYGETVGRGVSAVKDWGTDKAKGWAKKGGPGSQTAARIAAAGEAGRAARAEAKAQRPMPKDELLAYLNKGPSRTKTGQEAYTARLRQALTDEDIRNDLGPEKMRELLQATVPESGGKTAQQMLEHTYAGDASFQKQWKGLKKSSASVFDNLDEAIKERKDVEEMDKSQYEDQRVHDFLSKKDYQYRDSHGNIQYETIDDPAAEGGKRRMTYVEAIQAGKMGLRTKELLEKGEQKIKERQSLTSEEGRKKVVEILMGGAGDQVDALAKQSDFAGRGADELLEMGLQAAGKDVPKRANVRAALMRAKNLTSRQAFGGTEEETPDPKTGEMLRTGFASRDAEADFRAAINSNRDLLRQIISGDDRHMRAMAASRISAGTIREMIKEFENTPDTEIDVKDTLQTNIDNLFTAINQSRGRWGAGDELRSHLNALVGLAPAFEKRKEEWRERSGELMRTTVLGQMARKKPAVPPPPPVP